MPGFQTSLVRLSALAAAVLLGFAAQEASSQTANDGFGANVSGDGYASVNAVVVQPDGKILIGGIFNKVNGVTRSNLARLNIDGSLDTSFDPIVSGSAISGYVAVYALALQPDGRILVGGESTTVGECERPNIARLETNGVVDTNFSAAAGWRVACLALQADGKLLVGGWFETLNGEPHEGLGRFNSDGSLDGSFTATVNNIVSSVAVQPDQKILVSGAFDRVNGIRLDSLARLLPSGQLDPTFHAQVSDSADSIVLQPDGKIIIGGDFDSVGPFKVVFIARLFPDGSTDESFNPGANRDVTCMALQPDGKLLLAGAFTMLGGQPRQHLARLNPDGTLDSSFAPLLSDSLLSDYVYCLALQSDAKILVGGEFTSLAGTNANHLGRLYSDGALDGTFALAALPTAGFWPGVNAFAIQPDGKVLIGGAFTNLGGQTRNYIGRVNPDGTLDPTFHPDADAEVYCLAVQTDGRILVGGAFTNLAGHVQRCLGRLNYDGSFDTNFSCQVLGAYVTALALEWDGRIWVGGKFYALNLQYAPRLGRLNPNGSTDLSFQAATGCDLCDSDDAAVLTLALQPDGKVVVGGLFDEYDDSPVNNLARLNPDGSLDSDFHGGAEGVNFSFSPDVESVAVQADGKILVGGLFNTLGGQPRLSLGRFNADGTVDLAFNPGANGETDSFALQADGRILLSGFFKTLAGQNRFGLARFSAIGMLDSTFDAHLSNRGLPDLVWVKGIALQPDGKIWAGGVFDSVGDLPRTNAARLATATPASQSLAVDTAGTGIVWTRVGTAPDVSAAAFELSFNARDYSSLGQPARIPGGWQLTGLSLPLATTFYVRARGRTAGGEFNGSSGLIEYVQQFYLTPPRITPLVKLLEGNLEIIAAGAAHQNCILLSTPSLPAPVWTPVWTNTSDDAGLATFLISPTNTARFYRALWPAQYAPLTRMRRP